MSWSKTGSIKPPSGGKVRIKTKAGHGALSDIETSQLSQAVSTSRTILPHVLRQLCWPETATKAARNARLARYFLTDPAKPDMSDVNKIYATLELVMNGINTKVNVKVAPDDGAYGYVGLHGGAKGVIRGLFSRRHTFQKFGGKTYALGDIHIDRDTLPDADLAIITFIHEASHKYAGTDDFDDRGYLENTGMAFEAPGLQKHEALKNADSYAWFCFAEYYGL